MLPPEFGGNTPVPPYDNPEGPVDPVIDDGAPHPVGKSLLLFGSAFQQKVFFNFVYAHTEGEEGPGGPEPENVVEPDDETFLDTDSSKDSSNKDTVVKS